MLAAILILLFVSPAAAQTRPTGYVSAFLDVFPNASPETVELRARAFAEQKLAPSDRLRLTFAGFAEGLLRQLAATKPKAKSDRTVKDGILRVHDASVEVTAGRIDVLAGFTRVAWGRLDELQPTDVINPLDVSRFFFEGRSEARMPVPLVRARWFLTDDVTVEGVYVPVFRRGRFDRLDESTSPFNLAPHIPTVTIEPARTLSNAQGGARFSATTGRVDWSVSAYRGFDPFGVYVPAAALTRIFPAFTMVGADFETVRGEWGIRGELAAFVQDTFQDVGGPVTGSSFDAGVGVDRKAGDYRVSGTVLLHRERYDTPVLTGGAPENSRTDVSFIASADRSFTREKYSIRLFGVYGATEGSAFVRGIGTAKLRDDLALESSIGWFVGSGRDLIGRFSGSDFAYARLKFYF